MDDSTLIWHGKLPPIDMITQTVREIDDLLSDGLERPEDLSFHFVKIDGHLVHVWGGEKFHARYHETYEEKTIGNKDGMKIKVPDVEQ